MTDPGRFPPVATAFSLPQAARPAAAWSDVIIRRGSDSAFRDAHPGLRLFLERLADALAAGADVVVQKSRSADGSVAATRALLERSGAVVLHAPLAAASSVDVHNGPTSKPAERCDVLVLDDASRYDAALINEVRTFRGGEGYVLDAAGAAPVLLHPELRVIVVTQGNPTDRAALGQLEGFTHIAVA